ncbi:MAG: hypothetical protein WBO46_22580, partial [Caldilineaceae bacterium]
RGAAHAAGGERNPCGLEASGGGIGTRIESVKICVPLPVLKNWFKRISLQRQQSFLGVEVRLF